MLEIRNAAVEMAGHRLFEEVSLAVGDGEVVGVAGPSGVGKTSLLRAVMGFLPLADGYISVDGELLTPSSAEQFRKIMAYMPQDIPLQPESVAELVALPFGLKANAGVKFSRGRLLEEWERLALEPDLYDKKMGELSGGQRQRVMLSVAGMLQKPTLIADEPTASLDANSSALVADYLRELAFRRCAVLVASHDEAILNSCDRVISIGA